MPMRYRIDILAALKTRGYSAYKLRKDSLLSEATIQQLRHREPISWATIETVCRLLDCQPGDIMEYVKD